MEDLKHLTWAIIIILVLYVLYKWYYQNFSIYTSGSLQRYASVLSSTNQRPGSISSGAFSSIINNPLSEKELFTKLHGNILNM